MGRDHLQAHGDRHAVRPAGLGEEGAADRDLEAPEHAAQEGQRQHVPELEQAQQGCEAGQHLDRGHEEEGGDQELTAVEALRHHARRCPQEQQRQKPDEAHEGDDQR
jgi:hypothetical protein